MIEDQKMNPQLTGDMLNAIMEATTDFIAAATLDGKIFYINKAGREMLGYYSADDVPRLTIPDIHPAWAYELIRMEGIQTAIRDGVWSGETALKNKNGVEIPTSQVIIFKRSMDGSSDFLATIIRDISIQKSTEKVLKEAKNTYHAIFENTGTAIAIIDEDSTITMVNKEFELNVGLAREQIEHKKKWMDFVDEADLGRMIEYQNYRKKNPLRAAKNSELTIVDRRGIKKNMYLTLGEIPGARKTLASLIDITELKESREKIRLQVEEIQVQIEKLEKLNGDLKNAHDELIRANYRLHESEERFRSLVETIPYGVLEYDTSGKIIFANAANRKILGYAPEEMTGRAVWDYIYTDDEQETIRKYFNRLVAEQPEPAPLAAKKRSRDGVPVDVRIDWNYRKDDEGRLISIVAMITDITSLKKTEESLRASEEKFSKAFHASPNMMLITDHREGKIIDVNDSFLKVGGFSRSGVIGRTGMELGIWKNKNDREQIKSQIDRTGSLHNVSCEFITYSGKTVTILFSADSIKVENEQLLVIVGTDISERIRAENDLEKSEKNFARIFHASPDAIGINRLKDATYVEVNKSALTISGYTREEVIGKTPEELGIFAKYRDYLRFLSALRIYNSVNKMEFTFRAKSGRIRTGLVSAEPIEFDGERCLITSILDITDRKTAERELSAERERLAITLRSIGDGVITTDIQGNIVLMNKIAEDLTGYTQGEAKNKSLGAVFNILNERTRRTCDDPVLKVLASGGIIEMANSTVLVSKDGTEKLITESAAPIKDKEDAILGVIIVFHDITEKKKIEEGLIKAQRLESLGILAGGIAHDFNNILSAILGNINLAKLHSHGDARILNLLSDAEISSLRARELTQQLLTFARGGKPVKKVGSIEKLIKNTAIFTLRGSNILCNFQIADNLHLLEYDEGQMGQVINNLVINAKQAMPRGGVLKIRAENLDEDKEQPIQLKNGDYVKITVEDEGIGIPEYNIPNIFDPYFTTKEGGSGLGLTTTYSIIINHNGYIDVKSQVNTGTVFSIYLPASGSKKSTDESVKESIRKGSGRILFLDDEELVIKVAGKMIGFLGYDVVCVTCGDDAVKEYTCSMENGQPFDAVMLDLTIPGGMGGREVMKILKEIDPDIKAIVSSGYSNDPIMADYKSYGFSGVVSKPYRIEDLSDLLFNLTLKNSEVR